MIEICLCGHELAEHDGFGWSEDDFSCYCKRCDCLSYIRPSADVRRELSEVEARIQSAYWTFTRTARGQPPSVAEPGAYAKRNALHDELRRSLKCELVMREVALLARIKGESNGDS